MANELQIFNHPQFGDIRALNIDGEPWFVAKDVAEALGYSNSRDAIAKHVDGEDKNTVAIHDGIPGNPNQAVINESGIYALVFGSQLPTARKFKRWVTSEVLPSIRKTGGYVDNDELFVRTYFPNMDDNAKTMFKSTLAALRSANEKIEADKPKVLFADSVSVSESDCTVGAFAKILRQNGVQIGRNRLFEWLRDNGYLMRDGQKEKNIPTQKSMEMGLFRVKETTIHNGDEVFISYTAYFTGKGQTYFLDRFLSGEISA